MGGHACGCSWGRVLNLGWALLGACVVAVISLVTMPFSFLLVSAISQSLLSLVAMHPCIVGHVAQQFGDHYKSRPANSMSRAFGNTTDLHLTFQRERIYYWPRCGG